MRRSGKVVFYVGCLLLLGSLCLLVGAQLRTHRALEANEEIIRTMESLLPAPREGSADTYRNMEMPVLEIGGQDYVALLEIPAFGMTLPVGADWAAEKTTSHPCRFWGTVYDGSFIVGGYDQAGQFDFFDRVMGGTAVTVTDMTGAVFSYEIVRVERSDSAEAEVLLDSEADLTLFVRDARFLEYIILRCAAA